MGIVSKFKFLILLSPLGLLLFRRKKMNQRRLMWILLSVLGNAARSGVAVRQRWLILLWWRSNLRRITWRRLHRSSRPSNASMQSKWRSGYLGFLKARRSLLKYRALLDSFRRKNGLRPIDERRKKFNGTSCSLMGWVHCNSFRL